MLYLIVTHGIRSRGISSVAERLLSMHEVVGSIPTFSTQFLFYEDDDCH